MAELLSQQEIDSLLSGVSTGAAPPPPPASDVQATPGREVIAFDFRLPHRLSKNQIRTLQAVHESFGESLGSYLLSRMQTTIGIDVVSVDQIFYSEFVMSVRNPSCLYIFRIEESNALAMIEFSPELVLTAISRLLGGDTAGEKKARMLTRIEQNIAKGIATRTLADLQRAWKTIAPLTFVLERYESEGDFAQVAPTSEVVLVVSLEVTVAEEKYLMNLCFPTFALEEHLAKLSTPNLRSGSTTAQRDVAWANALSRSLGTTPVPSVAYLGEAKLTVRELMELEQGDIIRTGVSVADETSVHIGGRPRLWGHAGVSNGRIALKISRILNEETSGGE